MIKDLLFPNLFVPSLFEIPLLELKKKGIRAIIFDLDNTIIAWESENVELDVMLWIKSLKSSGFTCCIVSNNLTDRVQNIAATLEIAYIAKGYKPLSFGFKRALHKFKVPSSQVAVVGDQIFTDVLGGNYLNLYTILVSPLSKKEFFGTKFMRMLEKLILNYYKA